jgi:hypothetical protein
MISAKQKKIASKAGDPNKIDAKDFAVLKAEKAKGRGMGLQDEQLPPGKMVAAKKGKMIKKAKDMSKLHENRETTMREGKETMMESKGYKESSSGKMVKAKSGAMMSDGVAEKGIGVEKKMGGGMIDPTMANYQKGGSVMARGSKLAKVRPTKLY